MTAQPEPNAAQRLIVREVSRRGPQHRIAALAFVLALPLPFLPASAGPYRVRTAACVALVVVALVLWQRMAARAGRALRTVGPVLEELDALGPPDLTRVVVALALPMLTYADRESPSDTADLLAVAAAGLFAISDQIGCDQGHRSACSHRRGFGWDGWIAARTSEMPPAAA